MEKTASDIGLSASQVRGARGMLDWSIIDLAEAARVSVSTIQRIENIQKRPVSEGTHAAIQGALEQAGVRFLADDGDGDGLRLRSRPEPKRS